MNFTRNPSGTSAGILSRGLFMYSYKISQIPVGSSDGLSRDSSRIVSSRSFPGYSSESLLRNFLINSSPNCLRFTQGFFYRDCTVDFPRITPGINPTFFFKYLYPQNFLGDVFTRRYLQHVLLKFFLEFV